jgi:hypothetical protein
MNDEIIISKENEFNNLSQKIQKNVNKSNTIF